MRSVGVREFKNRATQIVRDVRTGGEEYLVTVDGEPAVVVRAATAADQDTVRRTRFLEGLREADAIAEEVGKLWPPGVSAAQAIAEDRHRDFYGDP